MRQSDLEWTDIGQIQGLVTNIDEADLRQDLALRLRGGRLAVEGMVFQRDYGTKFIHATNPTLTGATLSIVGGSTMYDSVGKAEHEVVVCVDQSNNMHIFVYNSGWIELTETFSAVIQLVSGGSITIGNGAGDANVKNSMNADVLPTINRFQGFLVYNSTKAEYDYCESNAAAVAPATHANLSMSRGFAATPSGSLNWSIGDAVILYRSSVMMGIANMANGATPLVNFKETQEQRKLSVYISNSDASPIPRATIQIRQISADALKFGYGASALINPPAGFHLLESGGGALPFFVTDGSEAAPHTTNSLGSLTGVLTSVGTALSIAGGAAWSQLAEGMLILADPTGSGSEVHQITGITGDESITVEAAFSEELDSDAGDYVAGSTANIGDGHGHNWLEVRNVVFDVVATDAKTHLMRLVIVPILDGYQYGDPIYKSYIQGGSGKYPSVSLGFRMNWEWAPKAISGLYVYIQETTTDVDSSFAVWPDDPEEYKLIYKCEFRTASDDGRVWRGTSGNPDFTADNYFFRFVCTRFDQAMIDNEFVLNIGTLEGDLNRAPTYAGRTYLTPRFAVAAGRSNATHPQTAIVAVDAGDQLIRLSFYTGDSTHNEDIFADVQTDISGSRQQVQLLGSGEVIGMAFQHNVLYALRRADMDIYDVIANTQDIVTIDCIARRSILSSDAGLFWAGQNYIYWMPADGSQIVPINREWGNFYNGTLRASGGTPLVNNAQRTAIVAGWDKFYGEAWFVLESEKEDDSGTEYLCWRFNAKDRRWSVRKLANNTRPGFFATNRNDNTLIIGTSAGTLLYPNIASAFPRRDLVTYADAAGYGFESAVTINVGKVSGLPRRVIPCVLLIDFTGSVYTGTESFSIIPKANRVDVALQNAWTIPLASTPVELYFEPTGGLESLRLQLSLPTVQENLDQCDRWDMFRMSLGYKLRPKLGAS